MTTDAPKGFDRECGPGGLEARALPRLDLMEARAAGDETAPQITGYGSVSEQTTTIEGYFTDWDEEVASGAWAESVKTGDIRSMFNHDTNWLLGRTKSGSLRLSEDDTGLSYEIDIDPDDVNAMSVHAKVARGDVDGSSVWFRVIRQEWTYPNEQNELERPKRRILEGQLFETGPVVFPAFEQTTSAARSLAPVDSVLRAAGMTKAGKRARLAADLIADPESMEAELRALFAKQPELRDAICSCDLRAADPPPSGAGDPAPEPAATSGLVIARARLDLMRRTTAA